MSKEMTREEVMEYLNTLYMALAVFPNQQISLGNIDKMKESVSTAIKVLKQELVLDKVRAEIEEVANQEKIHDEKWALGLRYAVKIIDKYTEESEEV